MRQNTKISAALAYLTQADKAGAPVVEVAAAIGSTPDGMRAMLRRLRQAGHRIEWRRGVNSQIRLYIGHAAPPDGRSDLPPSVREEMQRLAPIIGSSGPEGLCYYGLHLPSVATWCFQGALRAMRAAGTAFSTRAGNRVFASSEWMQAYLSSRSKALQPAPKAKAAKAPKPPKGKGSKPPKRTKTIQPVLRASKPWQPPQPKPQQPAIIPPNVKRTVQLMPAYDARYQCEPGMRVVDGFATLGPGRYLDDRRAA